jgi:hypothetical protein
LIARNVISPRSLRRWLGQRNSFFGRSAYQNYETRDPTTNSFTKTIIQVHKFPCPWWFRVHDLCVFDWRTYVRDQIWDMRHEKSNISDHKSDITYQIWDIRNPLPRNKNQESVHSNPFDRFVPRNPCVTDHVFFDVYMIEVFMKCEV